MELFSYLDGYQSSSTRAELVALILSLYAPGPVHVALDNASVVSFAQFLLHHLQHHDLPCFDSSFCKKVNGDLWRIFYFAVVSKGHMAVKVSKTKGHALSDHEYLTAHPHLYTHAKHNDRSDQIARAALHKFYHPNLIILSNLLSS
eukprot:4725144-Karenia_brevis.AAC.1